MIEVNWKMHINDFEVLERCQCRSIETIILKFRLRLFSFSKKSTLFHFLHILLPISLFLHFCLSFSFSIWSLFFSLLFFSPSLITFVCCSLTLIILLSLSQHFWISLITFMCLCLSLSLSSLLDISLSHHLCLSCSSFFSLSHHFCVCLSLSLLSIFIYPSANYTNCFINLYFPINIFFLSPHIFTEWNIKECYKYILHSLYMLTDLRYVMGVGNPIKNTKQK